MRDKKTGRQGGKETRGQVEQSMESRIQEETANGAALSLSPRLPVSLPPLLHLLLAVLALGWAWTYMAARETPVGKIEGSVLLADLKRPLARRGDHAAADRHYQAGNAGCAAPSPMRPGSLRC